VIYSLGIQVTKVFLSFTCYLIAIFDFQSIYYQPIYWLICLLANLSWILDQLVYELVILCVTSLLYLAKHFLELVLVIRCVNGGVRIFNLSFMESIRTTHSFLIFLCWVHVPCIRV
jgi:hypothetical protein